MAVKDRVTIELYVDDKGTVKLGQARAQVEQLGKSGETAFQGTAQAAGSFDSALTGLYVKLLGLGAGVAGIYAIQRALSGGVEEFNRWNTGALKLSRSLGVTTQEASHLSLAMRRLSAENLNDSLTTDTVTRAAQALAQRLATNEKAINSYGLRTRETSGEFRNMLDILLDANAYLSSLDGQTAKNVQGQKLYGEAWRQVKDVVGLTPAVLEEARQKARDLGLEVGVQGVQYSKEYRKALLEMELQQQSLSQNIGSVLVPMLTGLYQALNRVTRAAGEAAQAVALVHDDVLSLDRAPRVGGLAGGFLASHPQISRPSGGGADIEVSGPKGRAAAAKVENDFAKAVAETRRQIMETDKQINESILAWKRWGDIRREWAEIGAKREQEALGFTARAWEGLLDVEGLTNDERLRAQKEFTAARLKLIDKEIAEIGKKYGALVGEDALAAYKKGQIADLQKDLGKGAKEPKWLKDISGMLSHALTRGFMGFLRGEKTDLAEVGVWMAEGLLERGVDAGMNIAVQFVASALGLVPPMVAGGVMAGVELTAGGAAAAAEMIFGAQVAASILSGTFGIPLPFHQGGLVMHGGGIIPRAHAGLSLLPDERLIIAQTGEGILPRRAMARLGPANFERLRRGEVAAGGGQVNQVSVTQHVHHKLTQREADRAADMIARALDRKLAKRGTRLGG